MASTKKGQMVEGPRPGDKSVLSFYGLGLTTLLLVIVGMVMLYSVLSVDLASESSEIVPVVLSIVSFPAIGLVAALGVSRLRLEWLRGLWLPLTLFVATITLQALVFTSLGKEINGNRNWLRVPGVGVLQPAEPLKLTLLLLLGAVLAYHHRRPLRLRWLLLAVGTPVALTGGMVLLGGDVGTAVVVVLSVAGALWMAGVSKRLFAYVLPVGLFLFVVASVISTSRLARILEWLQLVPSDPSGRGYQPRKAMEAIASGGWTGLGFGASRQKWGYLTQAENDYIFAIICEELGLLGGVMVLALFMAFGHFCMRIIRRSQDVFTSVVAGGIASWIVGQAIINIAVVVRLLPVLGVPLPFVSRGGSALVSALLAVGVLLCLARNEPGAKEALAVRFESVRRTLAVLPSPRRSRD